MQETTRGDRAAAVRTGGSRAGRGRRSLPWALVLGLASCIGGGAGAGGSGPGEDPGGGAGFEVPLSGEERSGAAQPAQPVAFGLPFAAGALADAVEVEFETSAEVRLPGESRVLSRHADGSVRWLLVELIAPPMAAGSALTGTLRPRGPKLTLSGALTVSPASGSTPLTVRNEHLTLRSSAAPGTLFELEGEVSGGLSAPAGFALETAAGVLTPQGAGELGVETQTELSVSLLRQDELVDAGGRPVARLSTRVTVWRGSSAVRVEHSLDLLRGSHAIESWDLVLPLAAPGVQSRIVDTDGSLETVSGDFDRRQVDQATLRRDGIDETGRLPGVVAFDGTLVGARNFWQLNPSALRRAGDTLHLELCPAVDGRREALDAGFGRTQELWIQVGPEADLRDPAAVALGLEAPLYLHADAAWYCGSEVLGPLAPALAGDHTELEELLAQSTDLLFWRRDLAPDWNYGLQHFGDFFDRANGVAYWGAQQQEYDPAWIILQQFMRTGDPDYLQPGLETAWHYADVDVSWYGGAFQHRATSNHVRSQMAKIVGATLRGRWESWGQYDGSVSNAFDWVAETYHSGFAAKVHKWILPEQSRGASGEEEIALLFCIVGLFEVNTIGESVVPQEGDTLYDLAVLFSQQPEMQALGYHDPDAQFADFFGFYGGDWDNFPSFHVDDLPVPQERHSGGHSLIQGVVLAHLLTGSPRLREVALSFGRHEVDEVAPWAIDAIVSNREYTSEYLQMRDLGWTVVDLLSVAELTEEMPGEEQLHADALSAAADCVATILETPVERYASSIQAGLVLEGLVHWDRRTAAPAARAYLHDLARTWAATQYDWAAHAFRYKSYGTTEAYRGMTGLVILGLCYSETLEHDPALYATLVDAWANLPASTSYAKAYSMTYRGAARAMAYVRNFPPPSP